MGISIPILIKAVNIVGGQANLADALGVTQPTISDWINKKTIVHPKHYAKIAEATGNQVTIEELSPDMSKEQITEQTSIEAAYMDIAMAKHYEKFIKKQVESYIDSRLEELTQMPKLKTH